MLWSFLTSTTLTSTSESMLYAVCVIWGKYIGLWFSTFVSTVTQHTLSFASLCLECLVEDSAVSLLLFPRFTHHYEIIARKQLFTNVLLHFSLSVPVSFLPRQWWGTVAVPATVGAGVALWAVLRLRPHSLSAGTCSRKSQDWTLPLLASTVCESLCPWEHVHWTAAHWGGKKKRKGKIFIYLFIFPVYCSTGQRSTCQRFQSSLPSSWKPTVEAAFLILRF